MREDAQYAYLRRQRVETTQQPITILDALSKDLRGSQSNLIQAGLHYEKWASHMGATAHDIARQNNIGAEQFCNIEHLCESPIEKMVLPWLIYEDYGQGYKVARTYNAKKEQAPFQSDVLIIPQFAILRFRVDFMVFKRRKDGNGSYMAAVECDGFDYHSRPKDVQRDGHMAMMGIRTIRASGAAITACPRDVSMRVAEAIFLQEAQ